MTKSSLSHSSDLVALNDDEVKRIISVIERDFKLRQEEYKRVEELNKIIRDENERIEYLAGSKDFNYERCIRCYKAFKILFNPREKCSECKLYVCRDCATQNKETKTWACKMCMTLKDLRSLTSNWFYGQAGKKHKRCGSAKVVRELYKRENELAELNELDEDLGYGTYPTNLSTNSKDSGSATSYVVHDTNVRKELNEYAKRLTLLIDNLKLDLYRRDTYSKHLSIRNKYRESLKGCQQQITSEICRARTAISGPLRRSQLKPNIAYETDLQNLLIQKTEQVLKTNLQQFQKSFVMSNSSITFDQKLAQVIYEKCNNSVTNSRSSSQDIDSSSSFPQNPSKLTRQSSIPSSINPSSLQLTQNSLSPRASDPSWKKTKSHSSSRRSMDFLRTPAVDEEDTEIEEGDKHQVITPTGSSIDDEKSDYQDNKRRFIDTDPETIKKSTERVDDWRANFTLVETKVVPSDDEEEKELTTWL